MDKISTKKRPTILQSLLPIFVLIGLIALNVSLLGDDTIGGANQMALIFASTIAAIITIRNGKKWLEIMESVTKTLNTAIGSILILLMIGVLAGTWMLSGVIPAMIYYGLEILKPSFFLPAVVIICIIVSLSTGSSWSTVATVGVALLGIGNALGFNEAVIAGAIVSGAYFGDKISPLSDTTNLASAVARVDLFTHIRYMMNTTTPTIIITLIIFTCLTLFGGTSADAGSVKEVQNAITGTYNINPFLFIVPVLVIIGIAKKMPPVPALLFGGVLGGIFAIIFQPELIAKVAGEASMTASNAYSVIIRCMYGSTSVETGNEMVNGLVSTSGMAGMLNTVWLIICAMVFGGIMEAGGFLERITSAIMKNVKSTGGIVSTTVGTCIFFNATTSDQYISIIVPGKMLGKSFRDKGLKPEVLSRTLEDSATVTSVLIPWNTCGATQAGVLGVSTFAYAPFAFFCIISPIMTMIFAWFNIKIRRYKPEEIID